MNKTDKKIKMVKLGDLGKVSTGTTPSKKESLYYEHGDIPFLKPNLFSENEIGNLYGADEFLTSEGAMKSRVVKKGAVLTTCIGIIGKVGIAQREVCFNQQINAIEPNPEICISEYLAYALMRFRESLTNMANAPVIPIINKTQFSSFQIPLPPLAEQKRIAEILDLADEARRKRKKNIALYDDLIRSLFLKTFGDPVSNPMGYELKALGKICDVRDGTHDSPKYVEKGYPLLTSKNLKDGYVDLSDINMISESDYEQINKRSKVDLGDILMPMIGTVGNPVLVEEKPEYAIKNMALIKFVPDSPDPLYVLHLLSSHYFDHATKASNRGGTQKFISLGNIRKLPIPIPNLGRQEAYIEQAEEINAQNVREKALYEQHDNLFNALLQRAFKGDL